MRNASQVYQCFIDFEEQAAAIYFRLASRFSPENPEASSLWLDMGIQEKQHAGLLQFCLAEELFAPELPGEKEIQDVHTLLSRLKKSASDPEVSLAESFRIAAALESSEINLIYDRLTTPLHSSMYLLQRKIATLEPDHLQYVLKQAKHFQVPEESVRELEQLSSRHSPEAE